MFSNVKRMLKYAPLSLSVLINTSINDNNAQNDSFLLNSKYNYSKIKFEENKKNEENNKETSKNSKTKNYQLLNYYNDSFIDAQQKIQQYNLIEKAIKSNNTHSVDSVIKFVDRDLLREYFTNNKISIDYERDEINLNRLRALTKTGAEIFDDRLNLIKKYTNKPLKNNERREQSLEKLAEYLGTKPGRVEINKYNTEHFFKLYQDDIEYAARENAISRELLAGLIKHESGAFNFAISETGAMGPGQSTSYIYSPNSYWPSDKKDINPFDTPDAIYRSAEHISRLIKKYQSSDDREHTLALSAYNQGETRINEAIRNAKRDGITKPKDIINYISYERASDEIEFEKMFFLSKEGRGFSAKVQEEMRNVQPYLANHLSRK